MTPSILIQELAEELRQATRNFIFQAEYQADKKVSVYEGFLPTESFNTQTFLPMIVVELRNVEDTEEGSTATVGLMFAVYGGEDAKFGGGRELPKSNFRDYGDGWRDLLNLAECVRQHLLGLPSRTLANKFRLMLPMTFSPQPDQPYPFFYGDMILNFMVGQPLLRLDYPAEFEESHVEYKPRTLNIFPNGGTTEDELYLHRG